MIKKLRFLCLAIFCGLIFSSVSDARFRNPVYGTYSESKNLMIEYGYGSSAELYRFPTLIQNFEAGKTMMEDWEVTAYEKARHMLEDMAIGYKAINIFPDAFENFSAAGWYQYENRKALDAAWSGDLVDYKTDGIGYIIYKRFPQNFRITFQGEHKSHNSIKYSTIYSSNPGGAVAGNLKREDIFNLDLYESEDLGEDGELGYEYKRLNIYLYAYDYYGTSDYSDYGRINTTGNWRRSITPKIQIGFNMNYENRYTVDKGTGSWATIYGNDYYRTTIYPGVYYQLRENVDISFEPRFIRNVPKRPTVGETGNGGSYEGIGASFYIGTSLEVRDFPVYDFGLSISQINRNYSATSEKRSVFSIGPDFTYSFLKHFSVNVEGAYFLENSSIDLYNNSYYEYGFTFTARL